MLEMGQDIHIFILIFIVTFTAFHFFCSSAMLAYISFLSRTTVKFFTHQHSFFAHSQNHRITEW